MHESAGRLLPQNLHYDDALSFDPLHVGITLLLRPAFILLRDNLLVKIYHNPETPPVLMSLPCRNEVFANSTRKT